jgi:hypothetical protein
MESYPKPLIGDVLGGDGVKQRKKNQKIAKKAANYSPGTGNMNSLVDVVQEQLNKDSLQMIEAATKETRQQHSEKLQAIQSMNQNLCQVMSNSDNVHEW